MLARLVRVGRVVKIEALCLGLVLDFMFPKVLPFNLITLSLAQLSLSGA